MDEQRNRAKVFYCSVLCGVPLTSVCRDSTRNCCGVILLYFSVIILNDDSSKSHCVVIIHSINV